MKLNATSLGLRIKQARTAKGWTQTQLAKALGVQRSSVVRWETGISVARNIPKISALLGQTPEWFLEKTDEGAIVKAKSENQELRFMRAEMRRLQKELKSLLSDSRPIQKMEQSTEPKSVTVNIINEKAQVIESADHDEEAAEQEAKQYKFIKDQAVLADILKEWNEVSEEARLMAALLVTGDWSYKLKLWNRNVSLGDDVLKAVRRKKGKVAVRTHTA